MRYHQLSFSKSLPTNLNILLCRVFGHPITEDPEGYACPRCDMIYSEIRSDVTCSCEKPIYYSSDPFSVLCYWCGKYRPTAHRGWPYITMAWGPSVADAAEFISVKRSKSDYTPPSDQDIIAFLNSENIHTFASA